MKDIWKIYGRESYFCKRKVEAVRHYHYIREATQYLWESEFAHCRTLLKRASMQLGVDYNDLLYLFADEFDKLKDRECFYFDNTYPVVLNETIQALFRMRRI